jgi:2,4-dienoyl-CoA reductase-like NADH-dependent reductase (Old Yellow Enzyme family)
MNSLLTPLTFTRGSQMKNRFMLAPLTNQQSHADGTLTDEEFRWLTMRAEGGFGLTMTCAAHVQAVGQGFAGQLGAFGDEHLPGLTRLAEAIRAQDSVSIVQLHHAGMRSPEELIGTPPVSASADEETNARALTTAEVEQLRDDFIAGAVRSEQAGFDGVELHGAHGYILCQFLSSETNRRDDQYGGSEENRNRLLLEIIEGIRRDCGADFTLGVRLSPERFGIKLAEARRLAQQLMTEDQIDFLDMSLWDVFKQPNEPEFADRDLLSWFTDLDRGNVRLGAAGKIRTPAEVDRAFEAGLDWVMLGRAAILHHDFPNQYAQDGGFTPVSLPVTADYLRAEGLSDAFVTYMSGWAGFVAEEVASPS